MKRYVSFLMGILGFVSILAQQSDYYYYYKGNRIDLTVDSTRLYVVSEGEFYPQTSTYARTAEYTVSNTAKSYVYNHVVPLQQRRSAVPEVYFSTLEIPEGMDGLQYDALTGKVKAEDNVWQVLPSFKLNGKNVDVTNNFFVKLKSAEDLNILQDMACQYGVEIVGYNESMPLWYTLSCISSSTVNAIDAANLFNNSGLFENSTPEFCYRDLARSDDELFAEQWNLKNTQWEYHSLYYNGIDINIEEAWEITKGENVVVAIFDNGVAANHPDLIGNMHSYSFNATANSVPATLITEGEAVGHGTACAGILAAVQDNEIGLSGVAPNAKIMDISFDYNNLLTQHIVCGFIKACNNGADVINCSWGGLVDSYIDAAIQYVLDNGRNRRGTVIVFAAGNDGSVTDVTIANNPRVLSVGAVAPNGSRAYPGSCGSLVKGWSSYYGEHLDIVAPGVELYTTDIPGTLGYDAGEYTKYFNKTSAAAPHVAGVAALVLSVYPQLWADEVVQVIERSARKIRTDLYTYSTDTIHWSGSWNEEVGYGLVDAAAAVTTPLKELLYSFYRNRYVDTGEVWFNYNVEVENVTVSPDTYILEIGAVNKVNIKSSFRVEKGGRVEIFNVTPDDLY